MKLIVAKEFSDTTGARYTKESEYSGQQFREELLIPKILLAQRRKETLLVDLDGSFGYGCGFLDEAFGGLVRVNNFTVKEVLKILKFKSEEEPGLIDEIREYIIYAIKPSEIIETDDFGKEKTKAIDLFEKIRTIPLYLSVGMTRFEDNLITIAAMPCLMDSSTTIVYYKKYIDKTGFFGHKRKYCQKIKVYEVAQNERTAKYDVTVFRTGEVWLEHIFYLLARAEAQKQQNKSEFLSQKKKEVNLNFSPVE